MQAGAGAGRGDAGEEEAASQGGQQEESSEAAHRLLLGRNGGFDLCVGWVGQRERKAECY